MIIQELKIRNLYGFLNRDIKFKNAISILVGINGSGKTSVLNIINWLLRPNITELCTIEFESIILKFKYLDDHYILTALQNEVELTLDLENSTKKIDFNQIQATFRIHPKHFTKNENLKETISGHYENLGPEEKERKTWNFLFNEIPKPIVIGLDRYLYTEEGDDFRFQSEYNSNDSKRLLRKKNTLTPLENVQSILTREYNSFRNKILQLNKSLNEKIILSSFNKIFTDENLSDLLNEKKPSVEIVNKLNKQVTDFLSDNKVSTNTINLEIEKVNNYFTSLKTILKKSNNSKELDLPYLINISQFKKINELIVEFSEFEIATKNEYSQLNEFLDIINSFFSDSAKQLYFDKETSQVKFNILNKRGDVIDENREIKYLSSGEKQILILLTYIKYNKNLNVFIIDEPELSLHPKWQSDFLEMVKKIMPKNSQLILATHSPEIIADNRSSCTILLPYNN